MPVTRGDRRAAAARAEGAEPRKRPRSPPGLRSSRRCRTTEGKRKGSRGGSCAGRWRASCHAEACARAPAARGRSPRVTVLTSRLEPAGRVRVYQGLRLAPARPRSQETNDTTCSVLILVVVFPSAKYSNSRSLKMSDPRKRSIPVREAKLMPAASSTAFLKGERVKYPCDGPSVPIQAPSKGIIRAPSSNCLKATGWGKGEPGRVDPAQGAAQRLLRGANAAGLPPTPRRRPGAGLPGSPPCPADTSDVRSVLQGFAPGGGEPARSAGARAATPAICGRFLQTFHTVS